MARATALALILSSACGCTASHEVLYERGANGVFARPQRLPADGRRLDGRQKEEEDNVLIVANPEEFFIKKNDTAITIYGTWIFFNDDYKYIWSEGLDLEVAGAWVALPESMKFVSPETGIRRVHISAAVVSVPDSGSVIEVTGDKAHDYLFAAPPGVDFGTAGADGMPGRQGKDGGRLALDAGWMLGGPLVLKATGGDGGTGQAGGDGRIGNVGEGPPADACCHGKQGWGGRRRSVTSTAGGTGSPGGAGGKGGNGGQGGKGGSISVRVSNYFEGVAKVRAEAFSGRAGLSGVGGSGGAGGPGAAGGSTKCVTVSWWTRDRRCFGDLGEHGAQGTQGAAGSVGAEGIDGSAGEQLVNDVTIADIRRNKCGPYVAFESHLGDTFYRQGRWEFARSVYGWVAAVGNKSDAQCVEGAEDNRVNWKAFVDKAVIMMQQIDAGLDYWGNFPDSAPFKSFDALFRTASQMVDGAKETERLYDAFFSRKIDNLKRKSLISKVIHNQDFDIHAKKQEIHDVLEQIRTVRDEIKVIDEEIAVQEGIFLVDGAECSAMVAEKAATETYGFVANLNHVVDFAKNVVATGTKFLGMWVLYKGLTTNFLTDNANVGQNVGTFITDSVNDVTGFAQTQLDRIGSAQNFGEFGQAVIDSTLATVAGVTAVNTLVNGWVRLGKDSVDGLTNTVTDVVKDVNGTLRGLQQNWASQKGALTARVQGVMSTTDFDLFLDEWFLNLDACQHLRTKVEEVKAVTASYQAKVAEHDALVLKLATCASQVDTLQKERESYRYDIAGTVDVTGARNVNMVTAAYRSQKDNLITFMKQLRAAMNFEFCEEQAFDYEEAKIVQIQSWLTDIKTERMTKLSAESGGRNLLAQFPTADEAKQGVRPTAAVVIPIIDGTGGATDEEFMRWRETEDGKSGVFTFTLMKDNNFLPCAANIRIISANVYVPALLQSNGATEDIAEVWVQRVGTSQCVSATGKVRTFAHTPRGYYSMYQATEDSQPPQWLTAQESLEDSAAPSPLGQWKISMPSVTTAARRSQVTEMELHLVLSYVPYLDGTTCSHRELSEDDDDNSLVDSGHNQNNLVGANIASPVAVGMVTFAVFAVVIGAAGLVGRKSRQVKRLASPVVLQDDQVELTNVPEMQ